MSANSRIVTSGQQGCHEDLEKVVRRHLEHPFQKPIMDYNRLAFQEALAAWQNWNLDAPLILDAGCGVGRSTIQIARQWPQAFVLGVDQSSDRLERGKPDMGGMPSNLALIRADLVDFWRLMAEKGLRLQRHYLLYPNPWPKLGHLQRRWHGHPVFPSLLALGGILECRSNWNIYMQELAQAIGIAVGQKPEIQPWQPKEGTDLTPFERKYRESGHSLWRLECDLDAHLETLSITSH